MLFNKQKREAKKRLKEEVQAEQAKARELGQQISEAEAQRRAEEGLLTKGLRGVEAPQQGFMAGLKKGLAKTRSIFNGSILAMASDEAVDEEFLEELEERLLSADLGVATAMKIVEFVQAQVDAGKARSQSEAIAQVKQVITQIMDIGTKELPQAQAGPTVYLFVGVNGVGKTTSIGKLAAQLKEQGKKVLVAAGDTFRAAAIEQLVHWCEQVGVDYIAKDQNSDPSATMYEAAVRAKEEGYDVLLCDTSGRLHNKKHLMDELGKMKRSLQKVLPTAPHASLLVIDANTGQNAIVQTKEFTAVVELDGLIVTKLDGTAKGGVVIGIVNEFELPVYFIGVGERVADLQAFDAHLFAESLIES
ncbi:MAG: signal recognition particle-docking protein FtsY [bacterium]|nr:signal recognition particle-docking protein FtsY [bacterium]